MSIERAEDDSSPGALEVADELVIPSDEVTIALGEVTETNGKITTLMTRGRELALKYSNVVADVRTTAGLAQLKAIREQLRTEVRYPMQELQKVGSKMLGTMQRQFNARCKELIDEAETLEAPFDQQIKAEEDRKEAVRVENQRLETIRVNAHIEAVATIAQIPTSCMGMTSEELAAKIEATKGIIIDKGYEEFEQQALMARDEAVRQLEGLLVAAKLEEEELAETRRQQEALRHQRAEQARVQQEQDERAADIARQQAELEKGQRELREQQEAQARAVEERKAAVQARIDAFAGTLAVLKKGGSAQFLRENRALMAAHAITIDLYDERLAEAATAKDEALGELDDLIEAAEVREEEARRQQLAQQIQARINVLEEAEMMSGNSERAPVQEALDELQNIGTPLFEDFGDRTQEATAIFDRAITKLQQALVVIGEREAAEAAAAEEQRRIEAEGAAARELVAAKKLHGEELYEGMRHIVIEYGGRLGTAGTVARNLLLRINPNETFED